MEVRQGPFHLGPEHSLWDPNWDRVALELGQPRILEDGFLSTTGGQTTTGLSVDTTRQTTGWTWPDGAEGAITHPKASESETGQQEGLQIYLHLGHL